MSLPMLAGVSVGGQRFSTLPSLPIKNFVKLHLMPSSSGAMVGSDIYLRLEQSQELIEQSYMSNLVVGVACGFKSASHLSRTYWAQFGDSPQFSRVMVKRR